MDGTSGNGRHERRHEPPPVEERFPRLSAADLYAAGQRPIDWLVCGVLVANQPMVLYGGEKSLKTAVAIDLAISLVSGTPFLGRYSVARRVNVGMFSGESGEETLGETATRIAASKGLHLPDYADSYGTYTTLPVLADDRDLDALGQIIQRDALGVIVIDPAYLCMHLEGREGSMFAVGEQLIGVTRLSQKLACTPIILHHTSSTDEARGYRPPRLQDIAFAGWKQWSRQTLGLSRRREWDDATGTHWLWCRYAGAGYGDTIALDVVEGRRFDAGGRRWNVRITTEEDARAAVAASEAAERGAKRGRDVEATVRHDMQTIMAAVRALGQPSLRSDICDRVPKISGKRFGAAWALLVEEAQVHQWPRKRAANNQLHPTWFSEPAPATEGTL